LSPCSPAISAPSPADVEIACSIGATSFISESPCCRSTHRASNPCRAITSAVLNSAGIHKVHEAPDGAVALDILSHQPVDLAIVDYKTGQSQTKKQVDIDDQLTIYALGAKQALSVRYCPVSSKPIPFVISACLLAAASVRYIVNAKLQ